MSEIQQMHEDLRFVRQAVARRERQARPVLIYYVWAVYVLVGYTLIDVAPAWSGWFFLAGGVLGGILSGLIGRRAARSAGEHDRLEGGRVRLHWAGGVVLAVGAAIA